MSDVDKLREALEAADDRARRGTTVMGIPEPIAQAARDYLALLESDAIVIKKVDGNWPEWWVESIAKAHHELPGGLDWQELNPIAQDLYKDDAKAILDTLADSSKAPE